MSRKPPAANIFFVKDGKLHTPTPDCFNLDGITRRTAIDLAKRRGIEVIERTILPEEMEGFEQCFLTGTAAEVTPVSEIGPPTASRWVSMTNHADERLLGRSPTQAGRRRIGVSRRWREAALPSHGHEHSASVSRLPSVPPVFPAAPAVLPVIASSTCPPRVAHHGVSLYVLAAKRKEHAMGQLKAGHHPRHAVPAQNCHDPLRRRHAGRRGRGSRWGRRQHHGGGREQWPEDHRHLADPWPYRPRRRPPMDLRDKLGVDLIGPHEDDRQLLENLETQGTDGSGSRARVRNAVPDRFLVEGETVSFGGHDFEVLHCPGHAPGHVVFYNRQAGFCPCPATFCFRARSDAPTCPAATTPR